MGGDTGGLRAQIRERLLGCGALAVGFAKAEDIPEETAEQYEAWLGRNDNAGMAYMGNHLDIRRNPAGLLEGAKTVISMAFSYNTDAVRDESLPRISKYAFLPDYHKWIRTAVMESGLSELLGEEYRDWRLCVDSAPIAERYWAVKAGIAIRGRNGCAIIPGVGCETLLAEIICRAEIDADGPLAETCGDCGRCLQACPTGALGADGTIDCNMCLSYLTIEHRGKWTDPRHVAAMATRAGRTTLFGCDRCVSVCPYNNPDIRAVAKPMERVVRYTGGALPQGSSLKRAKEAGLARNLKNCCNET